jgi:hypothetical protein
MSKPTNDKNLQSNEGWHGEFDPNGLSKLLGLVASLMYGLTKANVEFWNNIEEICKIYMRIYQQQMLEQQAHEAKQGVSKLENEASNKENEKNRLVDLNTKIMQLDSESGLIEKSAREKERECTAKVKEMHDKLSILDNKNKSLELVKSRMEENKQEIEHYSPNLRRVA